jgi:amino acid adenylation domain-containing protein
VVCGAARASFQELDEAATALAEFLASRGIGHGDRVGIFSTKSIEEIIAIFGILRSGAAFVHINPQYRETHLRHVTDDCSLKALLVDGARRRIASAVYTDPSSLELFISLTDEVASEDGVLRNSVAFGDILRSSPRSSFRVDVHEDDLASVIYTSGSTGMPKGIKVTHRIFYESTVTSAGVLQNVPDDRIISVTPFSFDGALSQLFTAMLVGGTLVQQRSSFAADIVQTLLTERITGFHAVPSLWGILLQERSPFARHSYPHLRYVSIIGEVMPAKHLARLREVLSATAFYMMYGTTEAFRSTYLPPADLDRKPGSIGIPFPGVSIAITDNDGAPCPAGQTGMIVHGGAFVSPGYWSDPRQTAMTFVNGGVCTGDLGWVDEEGYVYYVGRRDGMIKTQGFRVSPEEVETCIHELDCVAETVVVGVPAEQIGITIKAFVVLHPGETATANDIIGHCRQRLPHYMVPGIVAFPRALPKTSGNKVDRAALAKQQHGADRE